jgi:hypothetical protein
MVTAWQERLRREAQAVGVGFRLLGTNTRLSWRLLSPWAPRSPSQDRSLYPRGIRQLPAARRHLRQNLKDLAVR